MRHIRVCLIGLCLVALSGCLYHRPFFGAPLWRLWLLPGTLLPAAGAALLLLLGSPANHRGRAAHLHRAAAAARGSVGPFSANATGHGNMHFPCQPALVYGWRFSLRRATLNSSS